MTDKSFNTIFATNLNYYMELNEISQNELARRLGVSSTAVNYWCNATKVPRMDKVDKIALLFGIDRSDLINEHNEHDNEGDVDARLFSLDPREIKLLEYAAELNAAGFDKVLDYAADLSENDRYKKLPGDLFSQIASA